MPDVPAICSDCGAIFGAGLSSAIIKNTQFGGTKVGPCPECGGTGIIPDGIYSFVGDVVEVIATSVQGAKDIREIILRLSNIASRNLEPDQFRDAISKEVPELKKVFGHNAAHSYGTLCFRSYFINGTGYAGRNGCLVGKPN